MPVCALGRGLAAWLVCILLAGPLAGCAHLTGEITEEAVEEGTTTWLDTLSEPEHLEQLGAITETVSSNLARGLAEGLASSLELGFSAQLEGEVEGFIDTTFERIARVAREELLPVVGAMSGVAGRRLVLGILSESEALVGLAGRTAAVVADRAIAQLAQGIRTELAPALAAAIDRQIGPAIANTLVEDIGPALATVLRRDLVAALRDEDVRLALAEASYAIGHGMASGVDDAVEISPPATGSFDIDEIGDNLEHVRYWLLAAMGTSILLMIVLTVATTLRIVQGVRQGKMDDEKSGGTSNRHDALLEALLLNMVMHQREGETPPELRDALDERLRDLLANRNRDERPLHPDGGKDKGPEARH